MATLRKVCGDGFFLVGVFSTEEERLEYLIEKNAPKNEAIALIKRDADESNDPYGQYTRETFHLSDVFVEWGNNMDFGNRRNRIFLLSLLRTRGLEPKCCPVCPRFLCGHKQLCAHNRHCELLIFCTDGSESDAYGSYHD